MKKPFLILTLSCLLHTVAHAQYPRFSIATDISMQHSFKKEQRFTVIGQTVHAHFHLAPKDGIYVYFAYYSNGKFSNALTATAKSPLTVPQTIPYNNRANMRLKQFSTGWKKYLKGTADAEKNWNLYAYGGFGLLLGRIENTHSTTIDSNEYHVPVISGRANFKRLTIDAGLGAEKYLGGDLYIYGEGRIWIPTDGYPSKYIYINDRAPWTGMLGLGLRVLF